MHFCAHLALCFVIFAPCGALPNIFKKCKIEDNECLKSSVEYAISNLGNGLEELKTGPIDPLVVPTQEIQPIPGPVSLHQKYSNGAYRHLTQLKVMQFGIDLNKCDIYLEAFYPTIFFSTNYALKGRLLHLEVDAEGTANGTSTNMTLVANMTCTKYQQDDNEHIKVNDLDVTVVRGEFVVHFGDVFKGNDNLNEDFDKTLNNNFEKFLETIAPDEMVALRALIKDYINKVFSKYSVREIFEIN